MIFETFGTFEGRSLLKAADKLRKEAAMRLGALARLGRGTLGTTRVQTRWYKVPKKKYFIWA